MSRHRELNANTGVKVYFCDPHSPWQRGTCENTKADRLAGGPGTGVGGTGCARDIRTPSQ